MVTTVRQKNRVTTPAEVRRKLGIKPGWRLDWRPVEGRAEILVLNPERDSFSELVAERTSEG